MHNMLYIIGYSQTCQVVKIPNRVWDSAAQTVVEQPPTHKACHCPLHMRSTHKACHCPLHMRPVIVTSTVNDYHTVFDNTWIE